MEKRQGKTAVWTKVDEKKDLDGKEVVLAFPDWSSNSWVFDKKNWEDLPIISEN